MNITLEGQAELRAAMSGYARHTPRAARLAINDTAKRIRTASSRAIREQVALPARYVNDNLSITQRATERDLAAVISARTRPTRLARYGARQLTRSAPAAAGDPLRGISPGRKQAGVSVRVKRAGARRKMRGAFLIPLRNSGVMGVFLRTGPGEKDIEHQYGPSVDQVFRTVREDVAPDAQDRLNREFIRQLERLAR